MIDSTTGAGSRESQDTLSRSFQEEIVDNLYDGVYFVDTAHRITYWNKAAEELTGYTAQEAIGRHCFDNFLNHVDEHGRPLCVVGCPLSSTLADGARREQEVFLQHKSGHRIPVSIRVSRITGNQGGVAGAVEIFTDVSARKKLERRAATLEKLALNDALTGFPNRRYAQLKIRQAIQDTRHLGRSIGVLLIDLDNFKQVNDSHGHELGDVMLKTASRTLANGLRPKDFLGRWGGDEFLAIIADVPEDQLSALAKRSATLLAQSPTRAELSQIRVTASIGATLIRTSDTQASVVSRADQLMYKSKSLGCNQVTTG